MTAALGAFQATSLPTPACSAAADAVYHMAALRVLCGHCAALQLPVLCLLRHVLRVDLSVLSALRWMVSTCLQPHSLGGAW